MSASYDSASTGASALRTVKLPRSLFAVCASECLCAKCARGDHDDPNEQCANVQREQDAKADPGHRNTREAKRCEEIHCGRRGTLPADKCAALPALVRAAEG